jgi:hypothetical protein
MGRSDRPARPFGRLPRPGQGVAWARKSVLRKPRRYPDVGAVAGRFPRVT